MNTEVTKHKIKHTIMGAITFSFYADTMTDELLENMTDFAHDILYYYRRNYARHQNALINLKIVEFSINNVTLSINQKYLCKGVNNANTNN